MVQIIRLLSSIVVVKYKSHSWILGLMKKSLPPLEKKRKTESSEITNTHTSLIFMRANKFPIDQEKPSMYVLCSFPKESMTDTINAMDHPLREVVEGHTI